MNKFIFFLIISICTLGILNNSLAQPVFPDNGAVFKDDVVPRVDIFVNPDSLQYLYDHPESNQEFHADFIFDNTEVRDTLYDVGFRLRGNTSRYAEKKSFKVSFNSFEPGRDYYGLEKLNLNGEHNDPSVIRSKVCWDLCRQFNIPAPRSNHIRLYINNNYYGLYINVEHIDEEFVEARFGNKDGNLYKCLWPADLKYLGSNPELYKFTVGDRRTYDLKTNTEDDDYTDLAEFITILNVTAYDDFRCEIEKVFNIHDYLKIVALDIFMGNWDGYIYNKNNFYLYHNTETDKFEYIQYDLDNTLGIDWLDRDWGDRDIYDWEQHGDEVRPLYTRMEANDFFKDQYSYYFNRLLLELIQPASFIESIENRRDMIAEYIENDPFYPLDYGYSMNDFYNSYNQALGGHVDYGLFPYVETRMNSAFEQLDLDDMIPVVKYLDYSGVFPGNEFWAKAYFEDESFMEGRIIYSLDGAYPEYVEMFDDGLHNDDEEGDMIYRGVIPSLDFNNSFSFQLVGLDETSNQTYMPCFPLEFDMNPSEDHDLVINEFMALNETTIDDEFGEYDDWVEVYNNEDEAVYLGDKFLSDNPENPSKYQFPDIWLQPADFVLIWTDGDPEQGELHAGFKLSGDGEFIGIFDNEGTLFFPLDTLSFGEQSTDISYGRETDGNPEWIFFTNPTPGYSNNVTQISNEVVKPIKFYPNPVMQETLYFSRTCDVKVYDETGILIHSSEQIEEIDLSSFKAGLYVLCIDKIIFKPLIIL